MTGKSMPSLRLRPAAPGRGPVSQEDVCAASPPAGLRMGSQPLGLDPSRAPSAGAAAPTGSVWPISLSPELPNRWPLSALKVVDSVDFPGDISQPEPLGPKTRSEPPVAPSLICQLRKSRPNQHCPPHVPFRTNAHITPLRLSARPSEAPASPGSGPWGPLRQRERAYDVRAPRCPKPPWVSRPSP